MFLSELSPGFAAGVHVNILDAVAEAGIDIPAPAAVFCRSDTVGE